MLHELHPASSLQLSPAHRVLSQLPPARRLPTFQSGAQLPKTRQGHVAVGEKLVLCCSDGRAAFDAHHPSGFSGVPAAGLLIIQSTIYKLIDV